MLRQKKILTLLRRKIQQEKLNKEQTMVAVRGLLREFFDRMEAPERKAFYDAYVDSTTNFILTAIRIATPAQKAHAQQRMQGWIDDFNSPGRNKAYAVGKGTAIVRARMQKRPLNTSTLHGPAKEALRAGAPAGPHHRRRLETHAAAGARRLGLRPTPDRVRETVFNWINHQIDGDWQQADCLDLFAGSGALGFEAASRGARSVTMIDTMARSCASWN
jgi:hypothetical protein